MRLWQFLLNPRFLLCFGIGWIITNGWAYFLFGLGSFTDVGWMKAVAGAYLAMLWFPFTPEKIDAIQQRLCHARKNLGDDPTIWQVWQCNLDFHCDLIAVSDNPYLVKHLRNCMDVERRFYAQHHYLAQKRFVSDYYPEAHELILDAIRQGDRALALQRLRCDISEGAKKY